MVRSPVISWIEARYNDALPVDDEMVRVPSMVSQERVVKVVRVVFGPVFALLLFVCLLLTMEIYGSRRTGTGHHGLEFSQGQPQDYTEGCDEGHDSGTGSFLHKKKKIYEWRRLFLYSF